MQTNGAFGHKIYNGTALSYMNMLSLPNYNVMKARPKRTSTTRPSATTGWNAATISTSTT